MNPEEKIPVCIYSEPNFLAISIFENLLASNCFINVITDDINGWREATSNIAAKNKFGITGSGKQTDNIHYHYIFFCSGFINLNKLVKDYENFINNVDYQKSKTLMIVPNESYDIFKQYSASLPETIGVIYVGDLLGPRINLESDLRISKYLYQIVNERKISVSVGEVIYPLFVGDAAKQIVKWLFAFGPFGKETLLLGSDTSTSIFWRTNESLVGQIKYTSVSSKSNDSLPRNVEVFRISRNLNYCLTETYKWLSTKPIIRNNRQKNVLSIKASDYKFVKIPKNVKKLLLPIILVLIFPVLLLVVNGGLVYFSYSMFKSNRVNASANILVVNKHVSDVGVFSGNILKHIPGIGLLYKETEYASYTLGKVSDIGVNAIPLAKIGSELFVSILGKTPYSITETLIGSDAKLKEIYADLSEFEEKTITAEDKKTFIARKVSSKINLNYYKNFVSQLIKMEPKIPDVLGVLESKTYLILFENNMELRPTGGFIGSYGLLTFDKGRLSDFTISDIYSADGQLNGHVEPPEPIRKYLGEANWWFRDSNWDPDFPTSAKRAEWFLDKETDKQVDGVISLDLNPVKDFLEVSGPIYLSDFNLDLTQNNLYEKVQSEVQDNFFPGTHKKASFLTALSRTILSNIGDLSSSQKLSLLRLSYSSLDERHVQIFLHDSDFQKTISSLGWDGSLYIPACEGNCLSDLVAVVEANIGVNKANYFIERKADLNININQNEVTKTLVLTLRNSANTSLGPSGKYKSYVRLLVPENVTDIRVFGGFGQNLEEILPEIMDSKGHREIGTIFEVLGGETKILKYDWTTKLEKPVDFYELYFRKQAGVEGYPVSVKIDTPLRILVFSPVFSLTNDGDYVYNTTLTRDLFAKLSL
jgi:hypothetical protein